jgi:hypothetical protein
VNTPKKPTRRGRGGRSRSRKTAAPPSPPPAETEAASPLDTFAVEPAPSLPPPEPVESSSPERDFAARVPAPAPPRPFPATRRAIFFDVENSSKPEHVARVIHHLQVDRLGQVVELVGVGNWRVISHETARLLAQRGAHLVHSAPSVGVRDWSDLRIAVSAGVWLAGARPGDSVEIVSDDQAFDAVGDVAASLGVVFRRLSYRALAGVSGELPLEAEPAAEPRSRRRRRGGRGGRGRRESPSGRRPAVAASPAPAANGATHEEDGAHTAPHDELLAVARQLIETAPERVVTLDALSNALKAHGFRRTPGSPRLITRLRRIRELEVSRNGMIRLVAGAETIPAAESPYAELAEPAEPVTEGEGDVETEAEAVGPEPAQRARRRRRRGGRRRRGRGSSTTAVAPA